MLCITIDRGIKPVSCRNMNSKGRKSSETSRNPFRRLVFRKREVKDHFAYERYSRPGITEYVHVDLVVPESHHEFCHDPESLYTPTKAEDDTQDGKPEAPPKSLERAEDIQPFEVPETQPQPRKGFLDFPPEIRNQIYDLVIASSLPEFPLDHLPRTHILSSAVNLQRTCKTIYHEIPVDRHAIIYALHTMRLTFWADLAPSRLQAFRTLYLTQNRMVETPPYKYAGWTTGSYARVQRSLCAKGFKPSTLVFVTDASAGRDVPQYVADGSPTCFANAMHDLGLALSVATTVEKVIVVDAAPTAPEWSDRETTRWRYLPAAVSRRFDRREDAMSEEEFRGLLWRWKGGGGKVWTRWGREKEREWGSCRIVWRSVGCENLLDSEPDGKWMIFEWVEGGGEGDGELRIQVQSKAKAVMERKVRVKLYSDWREFCKADPRIWYGDWGEKGIVED